MSAQTIPLHLLKAQLELQLHLGRLLQESGQQWLDHAARTGPERIAETGNEIEGVQQTSNWQELATLPAQAFWRHAHLRMGHAQALVQTAVASQMTLAQGMQQAVRARACATKDEAVRLTTLKDCRCIFGVLVVWMRGT
jgi:hypothetical protein